MALAFLLKTPPHRDFFFDPSQYGIAGLVCVAIAILIGAAVFAIRVNKKRAKLPKAFGLFLGSGICLIALAFVLDALAGPSPLD